MEEFDKDLADEAVDLESVSVVFHLRDTLDNALLEDEGQPFIVSLSSLIRYLVMLQERFEELDDLGRALRLGLERIVHIVDELYPGQVLDLALTLEEGYRAVAPFVKRLSECLRKFHHLICLKLYL